jgi:hypothetical protein
MVERLRPPLHMWCQSGERRLIARRVRVTPRKAAVRRPPAQIWVPSTVMSAIDAGYWRCSFIDHDGGITL